MWLMLQQDRADDYVIATGESHSVRDLVRGRVRARGARLGEVRRLDPKMIRPAEVEHLIGDSSKARTQLNWRPQVSFSGLVKMMVDADLERVAAPPQIVDRLSTL